MWEIIAPKTDRLDRLLRGAALPGAEWVSRQAWETLVEKGFVSCEGRLLRKVGAEISVGSRLRVSAPVEQFGLIPAREAAAPVWLSDSKKIGVFQKDCGIDSLPLEPWVDGAFANRVSRFAINELGFSSESFAALATPPILEGGLLQRLDRDTSGLLLVAFGAEEKKIFRELISKNALEKTYLALAEESGGDLAEGEMTLWFCTKGGERVRASRSATKNETEEARIFVHVLKRKDKRVLVEVRTRQGLRHIVRAGLACLGAPLVGDRTYGGSALAPFHQLHASKLRLIDRGAVPEFPECCECDPPRSFLDSQAGLGLR